MRSVGHLSVSYKRLLVIMCDIISTSLRMLVRDVTLWLYALIEPTKCISVTLERNAKSAMDQTNLPEFNLDKYPYLHRL